MAEGSDCAGSDLEVVSSTAGFTEDFEDLKNLDKGSQLSAAFSRRVFLLRGSEGTLSDLEAALRAQGFDLSGSEGTIADLEAA